MDTDCEKVIKDNDRIKYVDIVKKITGKDYRICYEEEKGHEQWITGLLINYSSGNIDLYDYKKEAIYHIPYPNIRWMIPIKLKNYIMKYGMENIYKKRGYGKTASYEIVDEWIQ